MKKTLLLTCLLVTLSAKSQPVFEWAKTMGSTQADHGTSMVLDASGNIYITGHFDGTVDFDPGPATSNLTASGNNDIYILKLNAAGRFLWCTKTGGNFANTIALDASGNILLAGVFSGTADFDPEAGKFELTSTGINNPFVCKLTSSGSFVWARHVTCNTLSEMNLDANGNIYLTGYFTTTADFDPGPGTVNLTPEPLGDVYILKLDASGNYAWAKTIGGASSDAGLDVVVDQSGNVFATGHFFETIDLDPGAATYNATSNGQQDVYILKLDASGNFAWGKTIGGTNNDYAGIIVRDPAGNIYASGSFKGTIDFDPGAGISTLMGGFQAMFILKLDASGNFVLARHFPGVTSAIEYMGSMVLDASGNIYTSGYFTNTVDFDPGAGTFNLISDGNYNDVFISKLDASGNFVWATKFGGPSTDRGFDLAVNAKNEVYTTGLYSVTADFDPGPVTDNQTSNGGSDIFIHKLGDGINSVNDQLHPDAWNIYPNPAKRFIEITLSNASENTSLQIYDCSGKLIFSQMLAEHKQSIDLSAYASGLYVLRLLRDEQMIASEKIILE